MEKKKIAIFGDSVLRGIVLSEDKDRYIFADIDWKEIEQKLGVEIDNRSRMGATVEYGYAALSSYLENNDCYAAIIEYGGNDCDYKWEEVAEDAGVSHMPRISPEDFERTLNDMLDLLAARNIKSILMTLPPISASKYYKWFTGKGLNEENIMKHLGDVDVIYRHQEYYNDIVRSTAAKRGADLVHVREKFLLRNDLHALICRDGIHPNPEGEQIIIKAFLDKYSPKADSVIQ